LGELGWKEVLKEFIDEPRSTAMAAEWDGDDYATFEQKNSKRLILFARIRLADIVSATRFFTEYSGALEKKYPDRTDISRRSNSCRLIPVRATYFAVQRQGMHHPGGGSSAMFLQWTAKLNWRLVPESPQAQPLPISGRHNQHPGDGLRLRPRFLTNHSRQSASLDSV